MYFYVIYNIKENSYVARFKREDSLFTNNIMNIRKFSSSAQAEYFMIDKDHEYIVRCDVTN